MLTNIRFGQRRKQHIMYVKNRGRSAAYISNFSFWKRYFKKDEDSAIRLIIACISHETLHLVLNRISLTASRRLDRVCRGSTLGYHGLTDL